MAADVTDPDQVSGGGGRAGESAPLRIAVNCAGLGWAGRVINRDGTPHDFDAFKFVLNVNLIGTFNVMRLAASAISKTEPLEDGERGAIVNTASVAAFDGQIGQLAYSASKGGVVGMTLPAARDLSPVGIRVDDHRPGHDGHAAAGGCSPRTSARPSAPACCSRSDSAPPTSSPPWCRRSCENPYLNGETIRLDGGLRMPPK